MSQTTVATGQRWQGKPIGFDLCSWEVTAIGEDGTVALAGPGRGRLVIYVSVDELEQDFRLVPAHWDEDPEGASEDF